MITLHILKVCMNQGLFPIRILYWAILFWMEKDFNHKGQVQSLIGGKFSLSTQM